MLLWRIDDVIRNLRHALRFRKLNGLVERLIYIDAIAEHGGGDSPSGGVVRNAAPLILKRQLIEGVVIHMQITGLTIGRGVRNATLLILKQ